MVKLNIKKDRLEIAKILRNNADIMAKNPKWCQEVADCILVYLIDNFEIKETKEKIG